MKIRNLLEGEVLPDELKTGYETCKCDPAWIWVAENEGKVVAILVAAPAHVVVILIVLRATVDAPKVAMYALLTRSFAEMQQRGYQGYVTWANPERKFEEALVNVIQAAGGCRIDEPQVCCCGSFEAALGRKVA